MDLEDLENLELLGLLVGLGCLDLEGQGLLLGHLILAALVVPSGLEVLGDPVGLFRHKRGFQGGHEVQVYQVYQAHL